MTGMVCWSTKTFKEKLGMPKPSSRVLLDLRCTQRAKRSDEFLKVKNLHRMQLSLEIRILSMEFPLWCSGNESD